MRYEPKGHEWIAVVTCDACGAKDRRYYLVQRYVDMVIEFGRPKCDACRVARYEPKAQQSAEATLEHRLSNLGGLVTMAARDCDSDESFEDAYRELTEAARTAGLHLREIRAYAESCRVAKVAAAFQRV